ncbi:hypothetical protein AB0G15_42835 [Streptosporangium sp. NPDC023825]
MVALIASVGGLKALPRAQARPPADLPAAPHQDPTYDGELADI